MRICVAVDGSKPSLDAVNLLIDHADWYREKPTVELVTVHLPVPKLPGMGAAVGKGQLAKYYEEEGQQQLAAARKKLDAAGIRYEARVLVGQVAEAIDLDVEGMNAGGANAAAQCACGWRPGTPRAWGARGGGPSGARHPARS
ncbi:MAG TPA: universal stress protein [Burkholderiales bacterium]|nr:universal stress protein [Burkholderiales bacterium]